MGWEDLWPSKQAMDKTKIMASIDRRESTPQLIIADISQDDTWIAIERSDAVTLANWQ